MDKYLTSNAWAFVEARKILETATGNASTGNEVIVFGTGYGPSGLPHIGTFGEVFRTTMVRQAFARISNIPTRLIAFSDDMDGLRKVPDNIPNQAMINEHLGKPLSSIPDPYGTHDSFGAHMNARLQGFLDRFGFDYEFRSATDCYKNGDFDDALLNVLKNYDKVKNIVLPTLGEERQQTYSPFLPVCPTSGKVLQVPVKILSDTEISYQNGAGETIITQVTGGRTKLQWKADWGMRWSALGVDYEMHGKDLTPSAVLSAKICRALGKKPPINYVYEMFLDENGAKISKSKGYGISLEDWLKYGTQKSLELYLFANPRKAKKLHFAVIPKSVDEYITHLQKFHTLDEDKQLASPVYHIHNGIVPQVEYPVSFSLLLNLASACNPDDSSILWGFIEKYEAGANAYTHPQLDELVRFAIKYYEDFIKPNKQFITPDATERTAILSLKEELITLENASADDIQTAIFGVGKQHGFENLREWFKLLYQVLLGQETGPRMGSFVALFGVRNMIDLIGAKVG